MKETGQDKITKLLFPLYAAELNCNEFDNKLEQQFGIEYEWVTCNRCGSKAFYTRKAIATKNLQQFDNFNLPTLLDYEFICAECGSCEFGMIQSHKFSEMLNKENEKVRKANSKALKNKRLCITLKCQIPRVQDAYI